MSSSSGPAGPRAQCLELRHVLVRKKCFGVNPVPERTGHRAAAINKIVSGLADIDLCTISFGDFACATIGHFACSPVFFFGSKPTSQPSQSILL
jgi:hypothetical protein